MSEKKPKKRYSAEDQQNIFNAMSSDLANGGTIADVCTKYSLSAATFHNWRRKFSGVSVKKRIVTKGKKGKGKKKAAYKTIDIFTIPASVKTEFGKVMTMPFSATKKLEIFSTMLA